MQYSNRAFCYFIKPMIVLPSSLSMNENKNNRKNVLIWVPIIFLLLFFLGTNYSEIDAHTSIDSFFGFVIIFTKRV